jgi:hypothetical protein
MTEPEMIKRDTGELIRKLHEQPHMLWAEHLQTPAHVHYKAVRMSDPPLQRPASRDEFRSLLDAFKVPDDAIVIRDAFGSGKHIPSTTVIKSGIFPPLRPKESRLAR